MFLACTKVASTGAKSAHSRKARTCRGASAVEQAQNERTDERANKHRRVSRGSSAVLQRGGAGMGRPRGFSTRNWFLHSASSFGVMLASKTAKRTQSMAVETQPRLSDAPPVAVQHQDRYPPTLPRTRAHINRGMRLFRTDRAQGSPLSFSSVSVSSKSAVKCSRSSNRCSGGIFRLRRNLRLSRPPALGRSHVADPTWPIPQEPHASPERHARVERFHVRRHDSSHRVALCKQSAMAVECRCAQGRWGIGGQDDGRVWVGGWVGGLLCVCV